MNGSDSRKRYREIGRVLAHHGFEWLWTEWEIGTILGSIEKSLGVAPGKRSQPESVRLALEELGPTFIKIGQMLSTRPDLVPPEYVVELAKLQDHAPKVPYSKIAAALRHEFDAEPKALFKSFDRKPFAAASIAQVHRAVLSDGAKVVVKVRRPDIEHLIEQDLAVLGRVARFLSRHSKFGNKLDLEGLVVEFAFTLRNELDFIREGQNAERIASQFAADESLHVPAIYWEQSTHAVLTMEEIGGIKIDDLEALDAAGIDRRELAERCAHIALMQVLDHGFFHADPHPGNFFVEPDGVIALIDYGMVGRLDDRLRESLMRLAMAVSHKDADRLIDELLNLGAARAATDREVLKRDLDHLLQQYDGLPLGQISAGALFRDIAAAAQRNWLRLPSDLILLIRLVAMDEGLGTTLDPDFKLMEFSQPYFNAFWKKTHSLKNMARRIRDNAIDMADASLDLPERALRLLGPIERGDLKVTGRLETPPELAGHLEKAANRIAVSVLVAGAIVGLSVLALVYKPAGLGFTLVKSLLAAGVAGCVWLLFAFWKSAR